MSDCHTKRHITKPHLLNTEGLPRVHCSSIGSIIVVSHENDL